MHTTTDEQTDVWTNSTCMDRQMEHAERQVDRRIDVNTYSSTRQTDVQTDRWTGGVWMYTKTDEQTDTWTDELLNMQKDRLTDGQMNKQTDSLRIFSINLLNFKTFFCPQDFDSLKTGSLQYTQGPML